MKTVSYRLIDGTDKIIEYDETAPCWSCGLPVIEASMGGTVLCPWCDCGDTRTGQKLSLQESIIQSANFNRSKKAGHWNGQATADEIEEQTNKVYEAFRKM